MFTLVGGGIKNFEQTHRDTKDVVSKDCKWIQDKAVSFDPEHNAILTKKGDKVHCKINSFL